LEASVLRWTDVNFDRGILPVRHGKGGKVRGAGAGWDAGTAAGVVDEATNRLYVHLHIAQAQQRTGDGRPLSGTDVYQVWLKFAQQIGLESKPHDARWRPKTEVIQRADTRILRRSPDAHGRRRRWGMCRELKSMSYARSSN
jgi:hypothetical protein